MLPEVNTTNPAFKVFQSSVVGSMQEAELKRKKKEPTRLKSVKQTKNKDQYSSTARDSVEKDETGLLEELSKEEKRKRQKLARHSNVHYAATAYKKQGNLSKRMKNKTIKPIVEI